MLNPEKVQQFFDEGYCVLETLLEGEALQRIRDAFDRLEAYRNLIDHDETLLEVAAHPKLIAAIKAILTPHPQLLQFDGIARQPGNDDQSWHVDFHFVCDRPLMVNVGVYLDALTAEKGPIWVVPGSHRQTEKPPRGHTGELPNAIPLNVNAGDAVIFDCAVWHKGGGNRSDSVRRAIFPTYGHYWMKRFETWMPHPTLERFPNASEELQTLLGIRLHTPSEYGGYDETNVVRKNLEGEWEA
jgi:ectoine hydroxylase-related dioxygenase (phytanoyl-CoA dioxygenase family)